MRITPKFLIKAPVIFRSNKSRYLEEGHIRAIFVSVVNGVKERTYTVQLLHTGQMEYGIKESKINANGPSMGRPRSK